KQHRYLWTNLQRLFQVLVQFPWMVRFARSLCKVRIPRIYDPVFVMSFYRYVRIAYNKGRLQAMARILKNALEVRRA
ncbi:MAG: hypothetical protein WAK96_13640, partial [Desulfobaccales bacterium]